LFIYFAKLYRNASTKKVATENKVSQSSVYNIVKKHRFHLYKMFYVQKLVHKNFDRKIEFCELIEARRNDFVNNIVCLMKQVSNFMRLSIEFPIFPEHQKWANGSVPFAHVAIDHSHPQQPMPKGFPLFKHCEWSIAMWANERHSQKSTIG